MTNRSKAIKVARENAMVALDQLASNPSAIEDYMDNMRDTLAELGLDLTPTDIWFAEDTYRRVTEGR